MSFWSTQKIQAFQDKHLLINKFNRSRLKHGAYELSLGSKYYQTSSSSKQVQSEGHGSQIVIEAGQFALLTTDEEITIPPNAIGLISIKAGIKFRGLVNISGFHVDPGYSGLLKFSVYNAGSRDIILTVGTPVFMLWLADMDSTVEDPYQNKSSNRCITDSDVMNMNGKVASPAALNERLLDLEKRISTMQKWFWALMPGTLILALKLLLSAYFK